MSERLNQLISLLNLQDLGDGIFLGTPSNEPHVRAFGGQVAAQALVAAGMTVEGDRNVHSLHSYFLRPGQPARSTTYVVDRVRDGRSFSTRRVEAWQADRLIFSLSASFHLAEFGPSHGSEMPEAPDPLSLAPFEERFAGRDDESDMARWFVRARPFDIRYTEATPFDAPVIGRAAHQQVWIKTAAQLPDNPLLHACVAAYASDMTLLDAILLTHGMSWTDRAIMGASLDHAMWFHAPFRADEWLLFDQVSPIAAAGRGLARGEVWTQDGRHVVSIVQEALLRPPGMASDRQQSSV